MEGRRRVVTAAGAGARALGLARGMALTQAQVLVPQLLVMDEECEADAVDLGKLGLWALRRYTPQVALDPPDGLMLDVTGATRPFGGVTGLLVDLVERLAQAGTCARAVAAPTYGAAHACSRFNPDATSVIEMNGLEGAIGGLPLATLRLAPATVSALGKLGIESVAELEAMARSSLALRFGAEPGLRLDQAYGRVSEPFEVIEAPERIEVERRFAEPISAPETLARYTRILVEDLCGALEEQGVGARRLDLRFCRIDNAVESVRIGLARPGRETKAIARLLCAKLESVDPGFGIERMVLGAPLIEPLGLRTITTLGEAPVADVAGLVDTLGNRLGEDRLYRMAARESHIPERSVRRIAPLADPTMLRWPEHWPRPARLLKRPEAVATMALLPDHPPVHFTWRGVRHRVTRADGPERIYGEWHLCDQEWLSVRDYFLVEDETGARYWVFRQGDGMDAATGGQDWFLHGIFA